MAGLLGAVSTARAQPVKPVIYVLPPGPIPPSAVHEPSALGLYVPGAGGKISRDSAVASLVRGKVENALLGGKPGGRPIARLHFGVAPPGAIQPIVYVQLPPPGTHDNTTRYRVVFVGGGYEGVLTSESTRIHGLVSVADIAPSLVDLREGRTPTIRSDPDRDAAQDLRELDTRLTRVHKDRGWTMFALVVTYLAFVALAPRAAVLAPAAAIGASLILSALGATRLWLVIAVSIALTAAFAFAGAARRRLIPVAVAIGGLRWLVPLGVLALVTVGWSKAGADGGGLVVFAAAFAVLLAHLRPGPFSWRRLAVVGAGAVALVFALIGIDAALGGSSHVTHSVGNGSLFGDFGRRLHLSWASVTRGWSPGLLFLGCLAVLLYIAAKRPRYPSVDAMLLALAVSLLVNDTPVDIILLGAIGCAALVRLESVDSRAMRRGALTAASFVAVPGLVVVLAGCGGEGTVQPVAQTVVGTVQQESPGKAVFVNQGCGACHTYTPAGPEANGKIGPDLDKLPAFAKDAKQPLTQFVHDSIVDPNKFVGKECPPTGTTQCPKNVMPKSYKSLPSSDLKALVDFLTKPQG